MTRQTIELIKISNYSKFISLKKILANPKSLSGLANTGRSRSKLSHECSEVDGIHIPAESPANMQLHKLRQEGNIAKIGSENENGGFQSH